MHKRLPTKPDTPWRVPTDRWHMCYVILLQIFGLVGFVLFKITTEYRGAGVGA